MSRLTLFFVHMAIKYLTFAKKNRLIYGMIRQPTTERIALAWHSAALAGECPAITSQPQCGWFRCRLTRGGIVVPVRIWWESERDMDTGELLSDEVLRCQVDGRDADPYETWTWVAASPITEAEFDYLTARAVAARDSGTDHPAARPRETVDWMATPLPFGEGAL